MSRPRQPQPSAKGSHILLEHVKVRPMRYWHIPRALAVERRAFADNPTTQYITAKGYDGSCWRRLVRKPIYLVSGLFLAIYIHYFVAFEVANGSAIATGGHGTDAKPPPNRALDMLTKFVEYISPVIRTPEQQTRREEFNTKITNALQRAFGRKAHMYDHLQLLCADPAVQGHGYGSTLMRVFNDMVDDDRRSAFLVSTDERNTAFYNAAGFVVVEEWALGENNPRWRQKPVVVSIMVRKATKPIAC